MLNKSCLDHGCFRAVLCILALVCTVICFSGCGDSKEDVSIPSSEEYEIDAEEEARLAQLRKDAENGMLILVNKEYHVEEDYVPADLVPIKYYAEDRNPDARFMRAEAADHFHKLVEAAAADGIDIVMTTAYRSYAFQEVLWNYNVSVKGSEEIANMTSARPGESEHQTGLAVDISTAEIDYSISNSFADTEAGRWVEENAHRFGFILRYLEGKTDITGYSYEPWHIRYVGVTAAAEIREKGVTLEEYLEELAL